MVGELELFTLDDAEYMLNLLDNIRKEYYYNNVAASTTAISFSPVTISIEELELDALESSLHGIADPIGQIKDWLYDRFQELVSWIADAISSVFETFYNTFIKPILDGISSTAQAIWDYISKIPEVGMDILSWLESSIKGAWNWIQDYIVTPLTESIDLVVSSISNVISSITDFLLNTLPKTISDVASQAWSWIQTNIIDPITKAFETFINWISSGIDTLVKFFTETLPSYISQAFETIVNLGSQAWNWIQENIITPIANALQTAIEWISAGIDTLVKFFTETLPSWLGQIPQTIQDLLGKAWSWIQENIITPISNAFQTFINWIESGIDTLVKFFTETLPSWLDQIPRKIQDLLGQAWSWIQSNIIQPLSNTFQSFINWISSGIETISKYLSETIPSAIQEIANELATLPQKVFEGLKVAGMTIWDYLTSLGETIGQWFSKASELLDNVAKSLLQVGKYLTGFINSITRLPEMFYNVFKPVIEPIQQAYQTISDLFTGLWEGFQQFTKDPWGWVQKNLFEPLWQGLQWIGERVFEGIKWLMGQLYKILTGIFEFISTGVANAAKGLTNVVVKVSEGTRGFFESTFKQLLYEPLKALKDKISEIWFKAFTSPAQGEIGIAYSIAFEFLWAYWVTTLPIYMAASFPKAFGDFRIKIDPAIFGFQIAEASHEIKLSEFLQGFVQGYRDFFTSFLTGTFIGIGTTLMRPVEYAYRLRFVSNYEEYVQQLYGDLLKEEIEKGAQVNMFVETPGISEIRDYVRRQLVLTEGLQKKDLLNKIIATMRAHLKLYGLPKWYIDYLSDTGEKLYYQFVDRFGKTRTIYLSTLFELPTHSEMARMTQRDIFPGVDVIKRLGWIRGWNEDLSVMMYLLTFKYPSFEKLWKFYMRATSGLLWFKPPEHIQQLFTKEAQEINAGEPIPPLDLQAKIQSPDQLKAFELAINTYFKWLEYSNFSWFTRETKMYDIPIGEIIYSQLGGWTADSWIMADVSADIPSKIDMRWMSRYGIFLYMSDKFKATGIAFESYQPMIKALPSLLEASPLSPIKVDLKWFSKLLQATGLHPAWVPIVTVAENIMAISDEMTLLRTGWLNLFKEGLLNIDSVEKYLAGLITVSYQVGYWDPEAKAWKSGWINLPVRWLPHERKLLQLRMSIDRVLDLYREIERYVLSGVRTLAITSKEAFNILNKAVGLLNTHYSKLTKVITGKEMTISFDKEYESLRLQLFTMIQDIEIKERTRYWWFRVSGWLLYRIAQGYVTTEDLDKLLSSVKEAIPITDKEIEAYRKIGEAVLGIVGREYIPTPSQLATLSEYIVIPENKIIEAFEKRRVPMEWRDIWKKYIEVRPIIDEARKLISSYYRARRYELAIPRDIETIVQRVMQMIMLTDREKAILEAYVRLEQLITDASRYRQLYEPTYSFLATLSEYVDLYEIEGFKEFMEQFVNKLTSLGVNKALLTAMLRYIHVRPVKSDYRSLLYVVSKAYVKGVVSREVLEEYLKQAVEYGFTKRELEILTKRVEFESLIEESREYIPTPSTLATMSEYVAIPEELVERVLEIRRVPEEWRGIWKEYIRIRPLSDDVRSLLYAYLRAKRYGVAIPQDVERAIKEILTRYGVSKEEIRIRELATLLDTLRETLPTLGQLGTMAEYIEIPSEFVEKVLKARNIPPDYAELWIKYISVRTISSEVNAVVSQYRRIYEYFFVTPEVARQVEAIMREGGWTDREIKIFNVELQLRKSYRVMTYLIPTIRQAVTDAYYLPEWEQLFEDLLKARGIDVTKYQKQIEYYKKLVRNRLVWRQIAWYRSRLVYAYANGVIDKNTLIQKLQKLKKYGLSDEEIELIVDGAELERLTTAKIYGSR